MRDLRWSKLIRSQIVKLGYRAVAGGLRLPRSSLVADFDQWCRLMDLVEQLQIDLFVDVGANQGYFSRHLRYSGYRGRIVSFEPISENCRHIESLSERDPLWLVSECALGAEADIREFHVNLSGDQTVLSSFLELRIPSSETRAIATAIRRLDDVLMELVPDCHSAKIFLKMDTQGFDGKVLEGAAGLIGQIVGLQSEVSVIPLYDGMTPWTVSIEMYEKYGFQLSDLFVVVRTSDSRIVEYDCVMYRPDA